MMRIFKKIQWQSRNIRVNLPVRNLFLPRELQEKIHLLQRKELLLNNELNSVILAERELINTLSINLKSERHNNTEVTSEVR